MYIAYNLPSTQAKSKIFNSIKINSQSSTASVKRNALKSTNGATVTKRGNHNKEVPLPNLISSHKMTILQGDNHSKVHAVMFISCI